MWVGTFTSWIEVFPSRMEKALEVIKTIEHEIIPRSGAPVKHPTSAQVMISQLVGSNPASGSVLTSQRLEPASDSVSPSLSLPLPHSCSVSLSKIKKHFKKFLKNYSPIWVA